MLESKLYYTIPYVTSEDDAGYRTLMHDVSRIIPKESSSNGSSTFRNNTHTIIVEVKNQQTIIAIEKDGIFPMFFAPRYVQPLLQKFNAKRINSFYDITGEFMSELSQ